MLYLLWGLTNLALFIVFLSICFKATRLVRNNIGRAAALIFVIGLFSFVLAPGGRVKEEPGFRYFDPRKALTKNSSRLQATGGKNVILQDNLVSKYLLNITYKKTTPEDINVPTSASSSVNGLAFGIEWIPSDITIQKTAGNDEFEYSVSGTVEWRILRFPIIYQYKNYEGRASIE